MIFRRGNRRSSCNESGFMHVLETDTMRFFALMNLCLLTIFALIPAIDIKPPEHPVVENEITKLEVENNRLNEEIERLKKTLAEYDKEDIDKNDLKNRLNDAEKKITEQASQITKLQSDLGEKDKTAKEIHRELERRNKLVGGMNNQNTKLKKEILEIKKQLKVKTKDKKITEKKVKQLNFESKNAFLNLFQKSGVEVFILIESSDLTYQALPVGGAVRFKRSQVSASNGSVDKYYVPDEIVDAFKNYTDLSKRNNTYIIKFRKDISDQIRKVWDSKDGSIIIDGDGNVL